MTGDLVLEVSRTEDAAVLAPCGGIDMDNAGRLMAAVREVLATYPVPPLIVVDLGRLGFCDSAALNVLLQARLAVRAVGVDLVLAAPPPQMVRLLDLTGTGEVFTVRGSVAAALGDGHPGGG
ncbi:STAS domain-containing protein [Kitasatospora sp. NPDC054939]